MTHSDRRVPDRWVGTPAEPYWMNPEACARLVEKHGSQRAAGRKIGVSHSTIQGWLSPSAKTCIRCGAPIGSGGTPRKCCECAELQRERRKIYHKNWQRDKARSDPEYRRRERERSRERYSLDSEYRRRQREYKRSPEYKKRHREAERWRRENVAGYRERQRELARNRYWADPETMRKKNREYGSRPEVRSRKMRYNTVYHARRMVSIVRQRAEELY